MAAIIRNQNLFCDHCGETHKINYPISVSLLGDKIKAFTKLHKDCPKTWKEPEADQSKDIESTAYFWLANGEHGMSSKAIWHCCMGKIQSHGKSHPYDPDDFSRCYKLFETVPEWREKKYVDLISAMSPQWANLMLHWDELTKMYEENKRTNWKNSDKIGMYELMQKLIKQ